ncbi:MAG: HAMP domain-containing histidine kinase [Ruminococcaceae bacterium]|nr:HAMP domain-containing histidine kinase [Oscillospiraceae bacterium]
MKKHNKKSGKIRWRIFAAILIPTLLIIVLLWIFHSVFLGIFYRNVKTDELKSATENVIANLETEDIKDRILLLSNDGNINIRVVATKQFETLYSTGEAFNSVTYGWETFGMFNLYNETVENGGELVQYYSENNIGNEIDKKTDSSLVPEEKTSGIKPEITNREPFVSESEEEKHLFRKRFKPTPPPGIFNNIGKQNDLLYAKIATLSDGQEVMVVSDTRITPMDSTVKALRHELVLCSVITVIVSLLVSFFVAKRVSKPIERINKTAKVLAGGKFDVEFDGTGYREIEELNDTLNQTAAELGKVDDLRRELVSNVSHDMRTPLTMIVGYSEVMRDIPGENNPENVQVIIDEANRLSGFVNSVLDLSKLQNGMEMLEIESFDMTEVLEQTADRYKKLLGDGAEFVFEYNERASVDGDKTKIARVINNLCDNAVNYANDPKKVTIRQIVTGYGKCRVEISDNGDGINPEELPYIWDRYYKAKKSHKRNVVGSGIGLSIVKEILNLHRARFGVESSAEKGSTFWFELDISK